MWLLIDGRPLADALRNGARRDGWHFSCMPRVTACNAAPIGAYKMQRSGTAASCSIDSIRGRLECPRYHGENDMKRLILTLIAGAVLASALGGCVVAPAPGYYYGGYYHHHGYYY
jgi:hypothetical protein